MTPTSTPTREESLKRFERALHRMSRSIISGSVSDEALAFTAGKAEQFADRMEATGTGRLWGVVSNLVQPDASAMLVIGTATPTGLDIPGRQGTSIEALVTFSEHQQGPVGFVHGGIIAALFDDLCAAVQTTIDAPRHSVTRQLNVTYHRPTPINTQLTALAEVVSEEERAVTVKAALKQADTVLAEADAVFRRPRT